MTRTTLSVAFGIAGVALVIVLAFRERARPALGRLALVAVLMTGIPALSVVLQGQGQVGAVFNAYRSTANNEIDQYREASVGLGGHSVGESARIVVREVPKSLVAPYPWAFDKGAATWDRALYPGMWVWYVLFPTAVFGLWRWRRRPELWLLVATVAPYLAVNVLTSGFQFRQRSSVEPLFVLFVVAGLVSWRQTLRWGASPFSRSRSWRPSRAAGRSRRRRSSSAPAPCGCWRGACPARPCPRSRWTYSGAGSEGDRERGAATPATSGSRAPPRGLPPRP